jgi:hypothetical protein
MADVTITRDGNDFLVRDTSDGEEFVDKPQQETFRLQFCFERLDLI